MEPNPLEHLKVAAYYGCLLVRPAEITGFDDTERPTAWTRSSAPAAPSRCRGTWPSSAAAAPSRSRARARVLRLSRAIIDDARTAGADAIVVACPMCHSNLDFRQAAMSRRGDAPMPILYITQLVGLALGLPVDAARLRPPLRRHAAAARPPGRRGASGRRSGGRTRTRRRRRQSRRPRERRADRERRLMARIGVFVCHCGENIGRTVDCAGVADDAPRPPRRRPLATDYKYMCSDPGQQLVKQAIAEHELDRRRGRAPARRTCTRRPSAAPPRRPASTRSSARWPTSASTARGSTTTAARRPPRPSTSRRTIVEKVKHNEPLADDPHPGDQARPGDRRRHRRHPGRARHRRRRPRGRAGREGAIDRRPHEPALARPSRRSTARSASSRRAWSRSTSTRNIKLLHLQRGREGRRLHRQLHGEDPQEGAQRRREHVQRLRRLPGGLPEPQDPQRVRRRAGQAHRDLRAVPAGRAQHPGARPRALHALQGPPQGARQGCVRQVQRGLPQGRHRLRPGRLVRDRRSRRHRGGHRLPALRHRPRAARGPQGLRRVRLRRRARRDRRPAVRAAGVGVRADQRRRSCGRPTAPSPRRSSSCSASAAATPRRASRTAPRSAACTRPSTRCSTSTRCTTAVPWSSTWTSAPPARATTSSRGARSKRTAPSTSAAASRRIFRDGDKVKVWGFDTLEPASRS